MAMTDQQLTEERKRAEQLRDLCNLHGMIDGQKAMQSVVSAIEAEQVHRGRGGAPQG